MKACVRVVLCCGAVGGIMMANCLAEGQTAQSAVTNKVGETSLPPGLKLEMGAFDGPMEHTMLFRSTSGNRTFTMMSTGPAYRSIIKISNSGSESVSVALDIDEATKKAILTMTGEESGQYWQFEPASVEVALGEKKDVLLFIGLNTGRWDRLTSEQQKKFKDLCGNVKVIKLTSKIE